MTQLSRYVLLVTLLTTVAGAQAPILDLIAPLTGTTSFNPPGTTGSTTAAFPTPSGLRDILLTEPLSLAITQVPTPIGGQLQPRNLVLVMGAEAVTPYPIPGISGLIFIRGDAVLGIPCPVFLLNSFVGIGPTLGPAISGPSNTLNFTIGWPPTASAGSLNFSFPVCPGTPPMPYSFPLGTLVLQAVAEDTDGSLHASLPVRLNFTDPDAAGSSFPPAITGISPSNGPRAGGTPVTVSVSNFPAQSIYQLYPPTIRFGVAAATIQSITPGPNHTATIVCITPPAPSQQPNNFTCFVDVTYDNNGRVAPADAPTSHAGATVTNGFRYDPGATVTITGLTSPLCPAAGQNLVINGSGFFNGLTVRFDTVPASAFSATVASPPAIVNSAGTQITLATPEFCNGQALVTVRNCDGGSATFPLTFQALTISGFLPPVGSPLGGYPLQIQGNGFLPNLVITFTSNVPGQPTVTQTINSSSLPAGAITCNSINLPLAPCFVHGPATVRVTNLCANGTTPFTESTFNYDPLVINPPTIPASGRPLGELVTLNGSGFRTCPGSTTLVNFKRPDFAVTGVFSATPSTLNENSLQFDRPYSCSGTAMISVTTITTINGVTVTETSPEIPFTIRNPSITSVFVTGTTSSAVGSPQGGTDCTITGADFMLVNPSGTSDSFVFVSSQNCPTAVALGILLPTTPNNGTDIRFRTPLLFSGPATVTVRNYCADGSSVESNPFTINYDALTVTGFDVATGPPEGHQVGSLAYPTVVRTITGTGFLNDSNIRIRFTSQIHGLVCDFQPTCPPPGPCVAPDGLSLTFEQPTFCSGPVEVRIINLCGTPAFSGPVPAPGNPSGNYEIDEKQPTFAWPCSAIPTAAQVSTPTGTPIPPELGGLGPFLTITDTGTAVTIQGSRFVAATNPILAPTQLCPGVGTMAYSTRVYVPDGSGIPQPLTVNPGENQITGTASIGDESGFYRPGLGFHEIRLENPACVNGAFHTAISNATCPVNQPPTTIRIIDGAPPSVTSVSPAGAAFGACPTVTIKGSNFFSRTTTSPPATQIFAPANTSITVLQATDLTVPAVWFEQSPGTGKWATRVTLLNETELEVEVPPSPPVPLPPLPQAVPVTVYVYNPDTQKSSSGLVFCYAPRLTEPTAFTLPAQHVLDMATLLSIAQNSSSSGIHAPPGLDFNNQVPAIIFARNPCKLRDWSLDTYPQGSLTTTQAQDRYDFVFLFNTLQDNDPGAGFAPAPRIFDFDLINLPDTITIPANTPVRPLNLNNADIHSTSFPLQLPMMSFVTSTSDRTIRVVVKAAGFIFQRDPGNSQNGFFRLIEPTATTPTVGNPENPLNPPLFLQSHGDLVINALVNLNGDSLLTDTPTQNRLRHRVDRTLAPAGGARGGRGGVPFTAFGSSNLEGQLIPPTPATTFAINLVGQRGAEPPGSAALALPAITAGGQGGAGVSGFPATAGGGGGAGYDGLGGNGSTGSLIPIPGGFGGPELGSTCFNIGLLGVPTSNPLIFGGLGSDFLLFRTASPSGGSVALATGLLFGGSGGGGGGASLDDLLSVPPTAYLGGRGGNGGGCLVLLADCTLRLANYAVITADGELGQVGARASLIQNNDEPNDIFLTPGTGGSGSGGTILGLAVGDVVLPTSASFTGFVSALGGSTPNPLPSASAPTPLLTNTIGGGASKGRIRFAVNSCTASGSAPAPTTPPNCQFPTQLQCSIVELMNALKIRPIPGLPNPTCPLPSSNGTTSTLPLGYFTYPTP